MRNNKDNITCNIRNITLNSKILTAHFTGAQKIITLCFIFLILSFTNIIFNSNNISALSYQSPVGISFTFNPTLSIDISSNLVINGLIPGSSSDSNIVNVAVATNTAYGYILSVNAGSDYLTHSNNIDAFSSIGTNASYGNLEDFNSNADDNTWSYSYKDNSALGLSWSSYSGLATETSKILLETNETANSSSVDFKIAAKASSTQTSGTYTGAIIFTAVAKPRPKVITDLEYMQDFADLDEVNLASVKSSMPIHSTFTLKDKRDEQEYTIAKLVDGKIWMTKNLNLAGDTTFTSDTTDFDSTYTIPDTQGWQAGGTLPASSTSGFFNDNYAYVYNSNNSSNDCSNGCYSYYSWDAATLGSGRGKSKENTDVPYSICPKGWKLPTSRTTGTTNWQTESDFYALAHQYGLNSTTSTSANTSEFYTQAGPGTTPNFLLTGRYYNGSLYNGSNVGYYWSSTLDGNNNYAKYLYFNLSSIRSADNYDRKVGFSIRCLAR